MTSNMSFALAHDAGNLLAQAAALEDVHGIVDGALVDLRNSTEGELMPDTWRALPSDEHREAVDEAHTESSGGIKAQVDALHEAECEQLAPRQFENLPTQRGLRLGGNPGAPFPIETALSATGGTLSHAAGTTSTSATGPPAATTSAAAFIAAATASGAMRIDATPPDRAGHQMRRPALLARSRGGCRSHADAFLAPADGRRAADASLHSRTHWR